MPIERTRNSATDTSLAETVSLVEATGRRIHAVEADVRDEAVMKETVDEGVSKFGRLDIVVANAGIASEGARLDTMSHTTWTDMIDVNLTGVWITTKVATPHIVGGDRGGSIVLTSSVGGVRRAQNIGHYIAAKHGVIGLMRSLTLELGDQLIRVNAVMPVQVSTPMLLNEATFKMFRPDLPNPTQEDFAARSQMGQVIPVPWVEADDISAAVLFLASDDARFITGTALPIDAGRLLK